MYSFVWFVSCSYSISTGFVLGSHDSNDLHQATASSVTSPDGEIQSHIHSQCLSFHAGYPSLHEHLMEQSTFVQMESALDRILDHFL